MCACYVLILRFPFFIIIITYIRQSLLPSSLIQNMYTSCSMHYAPISQYKICINWRWDLKTAFSFVNYVPIRSKTDFVHWKTGFCIQYIVILQLISIFHHTIGWKFNKIIHFCVVICFFWTGFQVLILDLHRQRTYKMELQAGKKEKFLEPGNSTTVGMIL